MKKKALKIFKEEKGERDYIVDAELKHMEEAHIKAKQYPNNFFAKGINDLESVATSAIMKDYDYEKNPPPDTVRAFSYHNKIHWKCSVCGNEWTAPTNSRTVRGRGCPLCTLRTTVPREKSLGVLCPELLKDWDKKANKKIHLDPFKVSPESGSLAHFVCPNGHKQFISIKRRVERGCPSCHGGGISLSEKILMYALKKAFPNFVIMENARPEFLINPKTSRRMEFDVYFPEQKIAVEYDGWFYHKDISNKDLIKNKIAFKNGITLYRIRENGCKQLNSTSIDYVRTDATQEELFAIARKLVESISIKTRTKAESLDNISIAEIKKVQENMGRSAKNHSIAKCRPGLLKYYDTEKNELPPEEVDVADKRVFWWKCENGHSFPATLAWKRRAQFKCPICANTNRGITLLDAKPEIVEYWAKDNLFSPDTYKSTSKSAMHLHCSQCGADWIDRPANLSRREYICKCQRKANKTA